MELNVILKEDKWIFMKQLIFRLTDWNDFQCQNWPVDNSVTSNWEKLGKMLSSTIKLQ